MLTINPKQLKCLFLLKLNTICIQPSTYTTWAHICVPRSVLCTCIVQYSGYEKKILAHFFNTCRHDTYSLTFICVATLQFWNNR